MVDISIVDGGYKLAYNWRVPHCRIYIYIWHTFCHVDMVVKEHV